MLAEKLQRERKENAALRLKNDQLWDHLYRQLDDRGTPYLDYRQNANEKEGGAVKDDGNRSKIMNFIRWPGRETVLASLPQAQTVYFTP